MTEEEPTIKELTEINRALNRRLYSVSNAVHRHKYSLLDSDEREIRAQPILSPHIVCARQTPNPEFLDKKQLRGHLWLSVAVPHTYQTLITRNEARLVLGKDYEFESTHEDVEAMLEAATGGPMHANAYTLGGRYMGIHHDGKTVIPVQYYRINGRSHTRLAIESDPKLLEDRIESIKRERQKVQV